MAMKRGKSHEVRLGMAVDYVTAWLDSLPTDLTPEEMEMLISERGRNNALGKCARDAIKKCLSLIRQKDDNVRARATGVGVQLGEQLRFYREVFDLDVDIADLKLPSERDGFGWLLLVPKWASANLAWAKCWARFKSCNSYLGDELNKTVPTNERDPAKLGTYAIRFRDRVEADEEWKDASANSIVTKKISTITLLERLLLELWYHWKTCGKHLDIVNWTLCSGSRSSDGRVPDVNMSGGGFSVDWSRPDSSGGGLRPREAAV